MKVTYFTCLCAALPLARRQDAGIEPEQVQAVLTAVTDGIGEQLQTILAKAREIDQEAGTREQKMGELEAEINEAALALSSKLLDHKQANQSPHELPEEHNQRPVIRKEPTKRANEQKEPTQNQAYAPKRTNYVGNMNSREAKLFKQQLKAEMQEMKDDMRAMREELSTYR